MIHHSIQTVDDNSGDMMHQPLIIPKPTIPRSARSSTSNSTVHSSPAATAVTKPSSSVIKLQFINTAHPSESTSAKRISQIRSHVAKDSHARRRQRKAGKACCSSSASASASTTAATTSAVAADSPARTESPDSDSTSTNAVALPVRARLPQSSFLDEKEGVLVRGFRRIAPKTGALDQNAEMPCPRNLIGDTRKDVWNGAFAWELTDDEYATFNFCECKHQSPTPFHPPFFMYMYPAPSLPTPICLWSISYCYLLYCTTMYSYTMGAYMSRPPDIVDHSCFYSTSYTASSGVHMR